MAQESGLATIFGDIQKTSVCHLGTWSSGGPGFAGLAAEISNLRDPPQPKRFDDSIV